MTLRLVKMMILNVKRLAKQAKGLAKRVKEHVVNNHFHTKPCSNLNQTLSKAKAKPCNMGDKKFIFAIEIFNAYCTDSDRFPPPYGKPNGPPYNPY